MKFQTTITITHPNGASVTYHVVLDPRLGLRTPAEYNAEVARITQMGRDTGAEVTIT